MYVCICNALTDADIRQATDQGSARKPAEVFAACRCRAQCGTCVRNICAMLGLGSHATDRHVAALQAVPEGA